MRPYTLQVLDEFYENLKAVGVSAATGAGMEELFTAVDECREEYNQTYKKELEQRAKVGPPPLLSPSHSHRKPSRAIPTLERKPRVVPLTFKSKATLAEEADR